MDIRSSPCVHCVDLANCRLDDDTSKQQKAFNLYLDELKSLVERGGPNPNEYTSITSGLHHVSELLGPCGIKQRHICRIHDALGTSLSIDSMQGFALRKPYGYAGDLIG